MYDIAGMSKRGIGLLGEEAAERRSHLQMGDYNMRMQSTLLTIVYCPRHISLPTKYLMQREFPLGICIVF